MHEMLKKLSTFVIIGLISLVALAACGNDDDDDNAEPTVTRVPATNAPADQAALTPTVAVTVTEAAASPVAASPVAGAPQASPIASEEAGAASPATEAPSPIVNPLGTPGATEGGVVPVSSPVTEAPVSSPVAQAPISSPVAEAPASPTAPVAASPAASEPVSGAVASPAAPPTTATEAASPAASPEGSPAASPAASGPGATAITVTAGDLFFDPKELNGAANTDVVITITNNGALAHDFSIADLNITSQMLNPGESTTVTVNAPAGSYTFICTVPGHAEAGMTGTLTLS
jgi:uncharacterized cupredoxin-like copper-binding protein